MSRVSLSQARGVFVAAAVLALTVAFAPRLTVAANSGPSAEADRRELASLEREVEAAFQRGDTAFLRTTLADDFRFAHGSGTVAGKAETLANFAQPGNFASRRLTSVDVELHGDVAQTTGRIEVRTSASQQYTVCYVRLYRRRGGRWQLLSHRTFRERSGFAETCVPR